VYDDQRGVEFKRVTALWKKLFLRWLVLDRKLLKRLPEGRRESSL